MKIGVSIIILLIGLGYLFKGFRPYNYQSDYDVATFGQLPALEGGRIKPLDAVARNGLLIIHGSQSLKTKGGGKITAIEWLMDHTMKPEVGDEYKLFRIDHPEILSLFGWQQTSDRGKYFTFNSIRKFLPEIQKQMEKVPEQAELRNSFEKALVHLSNSVELYWRLSGSLHGLSDRDKLTQEYLDYQRITTPGMVEFNKHQAKEEYDAEILNEFTAYFQNYLKLSQMTHVKIVPGGGENKDTDQGWMNVGESLLDTIHTKTVNSYVMSYGQMAETYRKGDSESFNAIVTSTLGTYLKNNPSTGGKVTKEYQFNTVDPFGNSLGVYFFILVIVFVSWLVWPESLRRVALLLLVLTWILHTYGLLSRMWIQGRPPVTNLYSSAIFIGWVAVLLGAILEKIYKNGVGNATASLIGFSTLLVAGYLGADGDTLEMMRAVLDSNFWLATHVPVVTIGYAATYLAGALAIMYILMGIFKKDFDKDMKKSLSSMVYGITCFALLFSFVGTMLGGVWADQSWGRFWGWDPKENGALLIVIWNAIILHSRWGGLVRDRGIMVMAIFGNVVTSWSYFGTNMLGVGLHSYGFTESTFFWLVAFAISQFIIMGLAGLPDQYWRSNPPKSFVGKS